MGSAAVYHISKTGKKILVLDKYFPPHQFGSSHGQSRIIREAYFESPIYVPLVQQSYGLWQQLERESGKKLFLKTGGLMVGKKDQRVFQGASASASRFNINCEYLDSAEIRKRYPAFQPPEDSVALAERNAGILFPEECIKTQLELSRKPNVTFQFNEAVIKLKGTADSVEIKTDKGSYTAKKVIASAGAWIGNLFPELKLPLEIKRQVLFWFKVIEGATENFTPDHFPIFIWEYEKNKMFYGFPDLGDGIKIAIHQRGKLTTADTIDRTVSKEESNDLWELVEKYLDAKVKFNYSSVCMYTNTPDEDFIIDFYPENRNIIIASPCSGHGFKFSSAIGKILCDLVTDSVLSFDISVFGLSRFYRGH